MNLLDAGVQITSLLSLEEGWAQITCWSGKGSQHDLVGGTLRDNSIYSFNHLYCWMCRGADVFLAFSPKVLSDGKDSFDQNELMHESANGTHK